MQYDETKKAKTHLLSERDVGGSRSLESDLGGSRSSESGLGGSQSSESNLEVQGF